MAKKVAAAPAEYTSAMDKLRDELAKSKDNYVRIVGEYLTEFLLAHPEAEGKLLDSGKSIKGSLEAVRKEAEKVKSGNMAVLDDKTVFGIVLGYFGIKDEPGTPPPATQAPPLSGEAFGNATMGAPAEPGTPPPATQAPPLSGEAFGEGDGASLPPLKGKALGETGEEATSSDPPQAAAHLSLKGKAFGETGKDDAADPFDLDALLGGVG